MYRRPGPVRVLLWLVLAVAGGAWLIRFLAFQAYPFRYRETVFAAALREGVDPYLVAAVIRVESRWRPDAVSRKGAVGLMQLMPSTAAWAAQQMGMDPVDPAALTDPALNIQIGVWYLSYLIRSFDGNVVLALAAYNGGAQNVRKWLRERRWSGAANELHNIPFPETRLFVNRVLRDHYWYQRLYR